MVALQRVDSVLADRLKSLDGDSSLNAYTQSRLGELVIMSRYPIVAQDSIWSDESGIVAQVADVIISRDTVRFINAQLTQSLLTQRQYDDERRQLWFAEYGVRAELRSREATIIDSAVMSSPHRVIMAVAMEDVASSYTYHQITNSLEDAFVGSGNPIADNYIIGRERYRLEYIMVSEGVERRRYHVRDFDEWSAHQMVEVDFKLND